MRHSLPSMSMLAVLMAALAVAPVDAHAQRGGKRGAKQRSREAKVAQVHFRQGRAHHERGEYDAAVREYLIAYELSEEPRLLFNIAQVFLLDGKPEKALVYYEAYLDREPVGQISELARTKIEEIQRTMAETPPASETRPTPSGTREDTAAGGQNTGRYTGQNAGQATPGTGTPEPGGQGPGAQGAQDLGAQPRQPGGSAGLGLRVAGLLTVGLGLASAGAGVYFGLEAQSKQDLLESQPEGSPWIFERIYEQGQEANRNMWIGYGVGAAAVVSGTLLYLLGRSAGQAEERRWSVAPMWLPQGSGSGLVLVGGF